MGRYGCLFQEVHDVAEDQRFGTRLPSRELGSSLRKLLNVRSGHEQLCIGLAHGELSSWAGLRRLAQLQARARTARLPEPAASKRRTTSEVAGMTWRASLRAFICFE